MRAKVVGRTVRPGDGKVAIYADLEGEGVKGELRLTGPKEEVDFGELTVIVKQSKSEPEDTSDTGPKKKDKKNGDATGNTAGEGNG